MFMSKIYYVILFVPSGTKGLYYGFRPRRSYMCEVQCPGFFPKSWLDGLVCASLGGSSRVPVLWCWLGPVVGCAQPIAISLMASGIGLCRVLLQSSSLEIVSGHLIRRICRRQVFTKTWSLESTALVCFHVPEPYNKTYFTLELKMVSLVLRRRILLFQTGFRVTRFSQITGMFTIISWTLSYLRALSIQVIYIES